MHQQQSALENIVEKGEIARNEQFLLFPQCFPLNQMTISPFVHIFYIISSFAAVFVEPKIGISGKVLYTENLKTAKRIDSRQPVLTVQSDRSRYILRMH